MISYTILLWGLAGPMIVLGVEIPHMMVFFSVWLCHFHNPHRILARSPINLIEFYYERLNANHRYSLIRIKEYAESIAFYAGEKSKKSALSAVQRRHSQYVGHYI